MVPDEEVPQTTQQDPTATSEMLLAYNYAKDFVKKELLAPGSAEFPRSHEKISHVHYRESDGRYKINSWVDSQNAYGAHIRTPFSCVIYFDGENVSCKELTFY